MKLKDIVTGRNYKRIEYRIILPQKYGGGSIFTGAARYMNGNLTSLDYDSYSLDDDVMKYEFHRDKDGGEILTVYQYEGEDW